jgi:hypothetical protein
MIQSVTVSTIPPLEDGITIFGLAKRLYATQGIGYRMGIVTIALAAETVAPNRRSYSTEEAVLIEKILEFTRLVRFSQLQKSLSAD